MLIIGHCPKRLEEIPAETTQISHRGGLGARDPFQTPAKAGAGWNRDDPVASRAFQKAPGHDTLWDSPWPSQAGASESSSTALPSSSTPTATPVLEVWRQLPDELAPLLSTRLLLMARRVQESRRSASLHNGGSR